MAPANDNLYIPGLFTNRPKYSSTLPNYPESSISSSKEDLIRERDRSAAGTLRFVLEHSNTALVLSHHDRRLVESFQAASSSDKAFVYQVADLSRELQVWCEELESWSWNGRFEDDESKNDEPHPVGQSGDQYRQETGLQRDNHVTRSATITTTGSYGGVSAQELSTYRIRLREITDQFRNIDMDEMKDRALTTHLRGNDVFHSTEPHDESSHARLDVLSALVTVTVLEALPHYTRVMSQTQSWNARIAVLELVPGFSVNVEKTKVALDSAWQGIEDDTRILSDMRFEELRGDLEEKVASLGQTIDFMLDTLEGLEDTLPEKWVDIVEALEVDYSAWTVAARKILLKHARDSESGSEPLYPPVPRPLQNETSEGNGLTEATHNEDSIASKTLNNVANRSADDIKEEATSLQEKSIHNPSEYFQNVANQSAMPSLVLPVDDSASKPTEPAIYPSLDQAPAAPTRQTNDAQAAGTLQTPGHGRGWSVESIDPEIANPDGSYKNPIRRRQSMYRTASTASIGAITPSEIRSVDLGRQTPLASPLGGEFATPQSIESAASTSVTRPPLDNAEGQQSLINDGHSSSQIDLKGSSSTEHNPRTDATESSALLANEHGDSPVKRALAQNVANEPSSVDKPGEKAAEMPELSTAFAPSPESSPSKGMAKPAEPEERANVTPVRPPQFSILPVSTDERIESKIDRILTTIPARINFSRRTNPASSKAQPVQTPEKPNTGRPRTTTPTADRSSTPSLTLAPADQREVRAAKSSGDSAIKVYHLYQEGRQHPIKLYVRLVGENGERVMVRVGGGWADLGEYLREYASHHSRTVVPEPNEPLRAVDLQQPSNTRVFSLPALPNDDASPSPTPPDSPSNANERRWSGGGSNAQRLAAIPGEILQVPPNRSRPAKSVQKTKSMHDMSSQLQADDDSLTSSSRPAIDLGDNDSPSTAKLTPEKKKWLQEMVSKAKRWKAEGGASSTSSSRQQREGSSIAALGLEDMGKVGATRRVFRAS